LRTIFFIPRPQNSPQTGNTSPRRGPKLSPNIVGAIVSGGTAIVSAESAAPIEALQSPAENLRRQRRNCNRQPQNSDARFIDEIASRKTRRTPGAMHGKKLLTPLNELV